MSIFDTLRLDIKAVRDSLKELRRGDKPGVAPAFNIMTERPCATPEEKREGAKRIFQYFTYGSAEEATVFRQALQRETRLALGDRGAGHFGFLTNKRDEVVGVAYRPIGERPRGSMFDLRQRALEMLPHQPVGDVNDVLDSKRRRGFPDLDIFEPNRRGVEIE